jgi:hypothetical protein
MKVSRNPHNLPRRPKDNKCPKCKRLITAWDGWVVRAEGLVCKWCGDA